MPVNSSAFAVGFPELWGAWGGEPFVVAGLLLLNWCYARGVAEVWQRVGRGRVVTRWQVRWWAGANLVLLIALASPLEALADTLFSAHMAQHVLMTSVAAPLLALSRPILPLLQGLPHRLRRRAARLHGRARVFRELTYRSGWPLAAAGLYTAVVWLWHLPGPYQAALSNEVIHALEHLTLLGVAVLAWWAICETGARSVFGYGTGIAVVFALALSHGALGAVLSFSPTVLYPQYAETAGAWGMNALHDQQLAGVIMWAPGKITYGLATFLLVIAWLRAVEAHSYSQ